MPLTVSNQFKTNAGFRNAWGGVNAMPVSTGSRDTAIGDGALRANTTASDNSAFGADALASVTDGQGRNTAVGSAAMALHRNTNTFDNVAVGYQALNNSSGGTGTLLQNTAIGARALRAMVTGGSAIGIGNDVLANAATVNGTIAIGNGPLISASVSNFSIAIGSGSSGQIDLDNDNIAMGQSSMRNIARGDDNIVLGRTSGSLTFAASNRIDRCIMIGRLTGVTVNNNNYANIICIGDSVTSNENNTWSVGTGGTLQVLRQGNAVNRATLVAGTVTVNSDRLDINTTVVPSIITPLGTVGALTITALITGLGGSFTITSTSPLDTSIVGYEIKRFLP